MAILYWFPPPPQVSLQELIMLSSYFMKLLFSYMRILDFNKAVDTIYFRQLKFSFVNCFGLFFNQSCIEDLAWSNNKLAENK